MQSIEQVLLESGTLGINIQTTCTQNHRLSRYVQYMYTIKQNSTKCA
jgi:hypothetical protein